ncbi:hypothetical protein GJAV_G00007770 [Gymnothorax javanicus]|nr:hypothetical protein GJAV_G00007770 [Gymnothorax javanicus]
MEAAIQTYLAVFMKASKGKDNVDENSFQKLIKKHLSNLLPEADSASAVKEVREGLEGKQEGKVNFKEFMSLLGYIATKQSEKLQSSKETPAEKPETE